MAHIVMNDMASLLKSDELAGRLFFLFSAVKKKEPDLWSSCVPRHRGPAAKIIAVQQIKCAEMISISRRVL